MMSNPDELVSEPMAELRDLLRFFEQVEGLSRGEVINILTYSLIENVQGSGMTKDDAKRLLNAVFTTGMKIHAQPKSKRKRF